MQDSTLTAASTLDTTPPAPIAEDPGSTLASTIQSRVEALIVSTNRPVPPTRIAQALGLIATPPDPAQTTEDAAEPTVEVTIKKPRRRKGTDTPDPLKAIALAVDSLNFAYASSNRSFRIELLAGGYRIMTLPEFAPVIGAMLGIGAQSKLSKPAVETLAIIAYRQPVTRSHLEAIRGVACGEVLKTLLDRRLITIAGRAEELGRPLLYATTRQFLQAFGLSSVKDLPSVGDLGLKG